MPPTAKKTISSEYRTISYFSANSSTSSILIFASTLLVYHSPTMQWTAFHDAFRLISNFNASHLSIPCSIDLSVEDLKKESNSESDTACIARLANEWQLLDTVYVREQPAKARGTGKRSSLAVPYNFNMAQLDSENVDELSDERIAQDAQREYFTKLVQLLQKVPKVSATAVAHETTSWTVQNISRSVRHDIAFVPELAAAFAKQKKHNAVRSSSGSVTSGGRLTKDDVIITITVFSPDSKLSHPKQCFDILGQQSIYDLQSAIYCVQSTNPNSFPDTQATKRTRTVVQRSNGNIGNSSRLFSSGDQDHGSNNDYDYSGKNCFCCIDGDIYTELCTPGTSATDTSEAALLIPTSIDAVETMDWLHRSLLGVPYLPAAAIRASRRVNHHASSNNETSSSNAHLGVTPSAADEAETVLMQPAEMQQREMQTGNNAGSNRLQTAAKPRKVSVNKRTQAVITNADLLPHREAAEAGRRGRKRTAAATNPDAIIDIGAVTAAGGEVTAGTTPGVASAVAVAAANSANTTTSFPHRYDTTALSRGQKRFEMKCSKDVRCDSVDWKLGTPYLYAHNGCEHMFYVSNIRRYNEEHDTSSVAAYPVETFRAKHRQRKCTVCEVLTAQYAVYGDRLAECSPCFYCAHCYHMLHYSADGELLYDDFQVFPYLHDP